MSSWLIRTLCSLLNVPFRTTQGSLPVTQQMTEMSISREDKAEHLEPGKARARAGARSHLSATLVPQFILILCSIP